MGVITAPGGADFTATESGAGLYVQAQPDAYFTIVFAIQHPFSCGYVHVNSSSVNDHPTIDPAYLSHSMDRELLRRGVLNVQNSAKTEPPASKLKNHGTVLMPGQAKELNEGNVEQHIKPYLSI